jgi:drug/metabolite transporter (DMT)-like permease
MQNLIPYLLTAMAPLCWAGDIVLAGSMAQKVPPFSLVFWRWLLAALIMLPFTYKNLTQDWPEIKSSWGKLCLMSVLGASGFITLLYISLHTTSTINSALIQTTMPFMIVLACVFLYGEKMSKAQLGGMALCFMGVVYVLFKGDWHAVKQMVFIRGDLLVLIATVLYGLYSALIPKSGKLHPFTFLFCISSLGAMTIFPFYVWELLTVGAARITPKVLFGVSYIAICPTIVAYLCWNKGISLIGPSRASLFMYLIPVFTAMFAIPFLKEPFRFYHVMGMMLIFCGMILFNQERLFVAN